jgi:hypothetical protein
MFSGVLVLSLVLPAAEPTPESRAVAFLSEEVPRWTKEHKCYSCHNNGDAARALFAARRADLTVPDKALADTLRWLTRPQGWDKNGEGDSPARDKALARIQFAASLVDATDAGHIKDAKTLGTAAALVAENQDRDGSWKVDAEGTVGSPATYGSVLATHFARRTLHRADPDKYKEAIAKADRWLREVPTKSVLDSAAMLLALHGATDAAAKKQRERCLEIIKKGERNDGGWGPYVTSGAEPFDTAIVVLALLAQKDKELTPLVRRGRAYLISTQHKDGSWPETTRPAGADSYAQRLSTAGWATQALLASRP